MDDDRGPSMKIGIEIGIRIRVMRNINLHREN